jgi:hypothetical protein
MTVSRRQFLTITGGLFGAAMLSPLAQSRPQEIDIMQFCDTKPGLLWDLTKPFAQNGRVFASDYSCLISVPESSCELAGGDVRVPEVAQLPLGTDGDWHSWPDSHLWTTPEGLFDCPHCTDGCDHCSDTGITTGPALQQVGDVAIHGKYDRRIRELPGVRWRHVKMVQRTCYREPETVVAFRFDGGEGLVMPVYLD